MFCENKIRRYICLVFETVQIRKQKKIMENQVAVHEAQNSEKVVKFINQDSLNEETQSLIWNGNLHGLYYDKNGKIVAEDIWGDVHENIEK
jgi:hypothetical protein